MTTLDLLARALLTAWLVFLALSDIRTGRLPNWLTLPVMAGAGLYHIVNGGHWFIVIIWVILFALWELNFMMAGDAKLLMALFALFPTREFMLVLAVGGLITLVPLLVLRYQGRPLATTLWTFALRFQNLDIVPTRAELVREGKRLAWVFCLPSIVYVWWFW